MSKATFAQPPTNITSISWIHRCISPTTQSKNTVKTTENTKKVIKSVTRNFKLTWIANTAQNNITSKIW
jgi:hypothetical protein